MTCDYTTLAAPGVQGLQPYQPGKPIEEVARELGLDPARIIKLASNENPLGPSPKALEAIRAALPELCRYPDGNGFVLKEKLAQRLGVSMDSLTLGNGSNDVLEIIARSFVDPDGEVLYSQHAFAVYPLVTQAIGAHHNKVPAKDWGHDLAAMAAAITDRTRLIFIANPNNPTGTVVGQQAIIDFMDQVPERIVVVLDEAYCEYLEGEDAADGLALLDRYPNLIVSRTFSKAWGLAAMRVGYGVSSPELAGVINRVRQPFNVDTLAQAAAAAVLDDQAYLEQSRRVNRAGLVQLTRGFEALGLTVIPSAANFVAVDVGRDAESVYQGLLRQGVIVRPIGGYEMPHHLRVSIGLEHENERCLEAMKAVLSEQAGG